MPNITKDMLQYKVAGHIANLNAKVYPFCDPDQEDYEYYQKKIAKEYMQVLASKRFESAGRWNVMLCKCGKKYLMTQSSLGVLYIVGLHHQACQLIRNDKRYQYNNHRIPALSFKHDGWKGNYINQWYQALPKEEKVENTFTSLDEAKKQYEEMVKYPENYNSIQLDQLYDIRDGKMYWKLTRIKKIKQKLYHQDIVSKTYFWKWYDEHTLAMNFPNQNLNLQKDSKGCNHNIKTPFPAMDQKGAYLTTYMLTTPHTTQELAIQSFNMSNQLLGIYKLLIPHDISMLWIKPLGSNYFIAAAKRVRIESTQKKIYLFKKGQPEQIDALSVEGLDVTLIRECIYSAHMNLLFIPLLEKKLLAYMIHNGKFKKVEGADNIIGEKAVISPDKCKENSLVLLTVHIKDMRYQVYRYRVKRDLNKQIMIKKMNHIMSVAVPITRKVDKSYRCLFTIFCSPKQPGLLFILSLEQLLAFHIKKGQIQSAIRILQHSNTKFCTISALGICIRANEDLYPLTWKELAYVVNKHSIKMDQ